MASVLGVKVGKCRHNIQDTQTLNSYMNTLSVLNVYQAHHSFDAESKESSFLVYGSVAYPCSADTRMTLTPELSVGDVSHFGIKYLEFKCVTSEAEREKDEAKSFMASVSKKTVNAFELLLAKGRTYPPKKQSSSGVKDGLSKKDTLFNDVVDDFRRRELDWPRSQATIDGNYFIQVLCNALWYITNQHDVLNDAASRQADVTPVPETFNTYTGYNDTKRKRQKGLQMTQADLESHSQALYSILLKPVVKSSTAWSSMSEDIRKLADCLSNYKNYLKRKLQDESENHEKAVPCKTIAENATIEHRQKVCFVQERYSKLDKLMSVSEKCNPVFFDESEHLEEIFETPLQRFRYFNNLHLSVPVYIIRFCPGGSRITTACLFRCDNNPTESQLLIEGARLLQTIQYRLEEVHSRAQKREFQQKLDLIATVSPAVRNFLYSYLTSDSSAPANPEMQERLRLISLGNTDLADDLRHQNDGRPKQFEPFFEKLGEVIEQVTAADERRHNVAHLSEWISVEELIDKTKELLPPDTAVPTPSTVRLQFTPTNKYTHAAANYTSRFQVQYKIQRRQLRVHHQDQHYCAAGLKYFKSMAVELEKQGMRPAVIFCDDKAKVPVGEPGNPVSTGVRGKKTLAPSGSTLSALDHDMTKASLTPSVYLKCAIPDSPEKSFVQGTVTTVTNDSIFQSSNPFRHSAIQCKIVREHKANILLKFTDGGTDQRNNLESVKCANICIFRELNLDLLVHARCAPGHSWTNPAERIMSMLNLGLQNCALERKEMDEVGEKVFRRCGNMSTLREMGQKDFELKEKWQMAIEPVQSTIRNRFLRLKLKDEPFRAMDPASDVDIDFQKRHLSELFPTLDTERLQKAQTSKVNDYVEWMSQHCRERHYIFQIKKCKSPECCVPSDCPEVPFLPDPMLDETGEHYIKYDVAKQMATTEKDRPSASLNGKKPTGDKASAKKAGKQVKEKLTPEELVDHDASLYTTQNSRIVVLCVECRKPRVVYSKHKLTDRQQMTLALEMSELDFTCGSPVTDSTLAVKARPLDCQSPVELSYYGSSLGALDICCHSGQSGAEVNQELRKQFKTVLPICDDCVKLGKESIVSRPFGKKRA